MSALVDHNFSMFAVAEKYFDQMDAAVERTKQNLATLLLARRAEEASAKVEARPA